MHPIALQFGSFTIHWYGVLVALGFFLGIWTASRRGVRDGLSAEAILDSGFWLLLGTLVGARALHVLSYWKQNFASQPHPFIEIFMIQKGGLVFYGGFIGASLAVLFYTRAKKIPLWKFADALAPSIALGYFFGRFGCLMTGCCFGKECHVPWAIHFPPGHETHPLGLAEGIPVHPTQIYDAFLSLGLYFFLAWLYRRKKFDGQIFAVYLVCYAVLRSFVEMFRGDYKPQEYFLGLSPGQAMGVFVFSAGIFLYWKFSPRKTAPAPSTS